MVFGPILKSSKPPSVCIESLLDGRGVGSRVGSWRGCLMRSFLGGDIFLLSLLAHSGAVLMARELGPREGRCCFWSVAAQPSCPTWGGGATELNSSLSEGTSVLEAVGPSLVEKVRAPEYHVLPTCGEWDKASGPNVKGFVVQRHVWFLGESQIARFAPS
jgi:hypothetical protein